jgi:hypothetical protein
MRQLALDAAYITFVVQMYLFAIPAAVSFWYLYREVIALPPEAEKDDEKPPRKTDGLPDLQPLNCPSCGAGVPLNESSMLCGHCGTEFPVPPEYEQIRSARAKTADTLHRAERYWRIVSVLTSNWVLVLTLVAAVWLIACLVLMIAAYGTPDIARFKDVAHPFLIPLATLVIWIAMLLFIPMTISMKARAALPTIENVGAAAAEETGNCRDCGGAIHFRPGDLAAVCGYCSVATYRVKIAVRAAGKARESAVRSSAILVDQMAQFRDSAEEYLSIPILLVAVPAVIVAVLWLLFVAAGAALTLAVWALSYLIVGLFLYPIPTVLGLAAAAVLIYFRKPLIARARSLFGKR